MTLSKPVSGRFWEPTKNYLFHYDAYIDVDDFEDQEELEAE